MQYYILFFIYIVLFFALFTVLQYEIHYWKGKGNLSPLIYLFRIFLLVLY